VYDSFALVSYRILQINLGYESNCNTAILTIYFFVDIRIVPTCVSWVCVRLGVAKFIETKVRVYSVHKQQPSTAMYCEKLSECSIGNLSSSCSYRSVGIATGYKMDGEGLIPRQG
jgi:hypothetical protein